MRDKPTSNGLGVVGYAGVAWVAFGAALAGAQPPPLPLPVGLRTTAPSNYLGDAGGAAYGPALHLLLPLEVQHGPSDAGTVVFEDAPPAPIELWMGLRKVGVLVPITESNVPKPAPLLPAPPLPAPPVKLASATELEAVAPAAPAPPGMPAPPAATVEVKIVNAVERESGLSTITVPLPAEPKTPPAANPSSANEHPSTADHHDETPTTVNIAAPDGGWAPAVAVFAGAVLTPLVLLAGLFLMLRHQLGKSGPMIRVEYAGGQPAVPLDLVAGPTQTVAPSKPADAPMQESPPDASAVVVYTVAPQPALPTPPAIADPEPTPRENFNVGPTYEEERHMRNHQAGNQQSGVLQQLYEDNMVLQKLLCETVAVVD